MSVPGRGGRLSMAQRIQSAEISPLPQRSAGGRLVRAAAGDYGWAMARPEDCADPVWRAVVTGAREMVAARIDELGRRPGVVELTHICHAAMMAACATHFVGAAAGSAETDEARAVYSGIAQRFGAAALRSDLGALEIAQRQRGMGPVVSDGVIALLRSGGSVDTSGEPAAGSEGDDAAADPDEPAA